MDRIQCKSHSENHDIERDMADINIYTVLTTAWSVIWTVFNVSLTVKTTT